ERRYGSMRTTLDISTILYGLVNTPDVKAIDTGGIYKDERPPGSTARDVVVASTTVDNEAFQTGVWYINIHDSGAMPDHVWFKTVADLITPLVKAHYVRNDYHLLVTNVTGPVRQTDGDGFYMSIRVRAKLYYNDN